MYVFDRDGARRRPAARRARQPPRRVDGRGAGRRRRPRCRRRAVPPRPAPAARRRQAGRGPVPRRLRGRRRQRRAVHAGRVHPLRRRARPVPRARRPAAGADAGRRGARRPASGPRRSLDALPLSRLYASVTPAPVQRLENVRMLDWERQGRDWRVPRSSLAPILRFADVDAFVQETEGGGPDGTQLDAFVQIGVAKEDQPHYLKLMARPEADVVPLIRHALGTIAAGADADRGTRPGRARARPHLRVADRPAPRRGGLCLDRDRHAADEGDPRPGRRAAPRAGGRPMTQDDVQMTDEEGGPIGVGAPERQRETTDDLDVLLAALPPEIVEAIHALPDRESLIEVVLDLGRRPEARYPSSRGRAARPRDRRRATSRTSSSTSARSATTTAPASSAPSTASRRSATATARSSG